MTLTALIEKAEKQKSCEHRVVQPYENEDADVEVCLECGYRPRWGHMFSRRAGRIVLKLIYGSPEEEQQP